MLKSLWRLTEQGSSGACSVHVKIACMSKELPDKHRAQSCRATSATVHMRTIDQLIIIGKACSRHAWHEVSNAHYVLASSQHIDIYIDACACLTAADFSLGSLIANRSNTDKLECAPNFEILRTTIPQSSELCLADQRAARYPMDDPAPLAMQVAI